MRGKTNEEIKAERDFAIGAAESIVCEKVEVIDSFYTDFSENANPLEYLARSIADLAKADLVYFADGWENARGCKIERLCAQEYGLTII